MPTIDRDYDFIARTYAVTGDPADYFAPCLPDWRAMVARGLFRNVRVYADLVADAARWNVLVLAELEEGADSVAALAADAGAAARAQAPSLSHQRVRRKAGENLASPRPVPARAGLPDGVGHLVEYVWVPPEGWDGYTQMMRGLFGPLGIRLRDSGAAWRMVIMEVIEDLAFDPTLPRFNQIHILSGDFDGPERRFATEADAIVRDLSDHPGIESALVELSRYRSKPRVSRSQPVAALNVGPD
jgi:hypothetical protein